MAARWWLESAEALNAAAPRDFFIPPRQRRESLARGDVVKLIFLFAPPAPNGMGGERMWVEVESGADGHFVGVLLNRPAYIESLSPGDHVTFGPEHVAALQVSEDELGYVLDDYAAVGERVRGDEFPHLVARQSSDARMGESDSGWRLAVTEDDGPPEWWELGRVTDRFPQVETLFRLDVEEGSWRWDPERQAYFPA